MAFLLHCFDSPVPLCAELVSHLQTLLDVHGRVSMLVSNNAERDTMRVALARAGLGLGIDVLSPDAWVETWWNLWGDGRSLVSPIARQLVMTQVLMDAHADDVHPLTQTAGTGHLLARIAADTAGLSDIPQQASLTLAEQKVFELVQIYEGALNQRNLIEGAAAAHKLSSVMNSMSGECPREAVVVYRVSSMPAAVLKLLAYAAECMPVSWWLDVDLAADAPRLIQALEGLSAGKFSFDASTLVPSPASCSLLNQASQQRLSFVEILGPHAETRVVVEQIEAACAAGAKRIALVTPRSQVAFERLAEALARRNIMLEGSYFQTFERSWSGHHLFQLTDCIERMRAAGDNLLQAYQWWPAHELTDWLSCPLSGASSWHAWQFDKRMRQSRHVSPDDVMRMLQSIQGRAEKDAQNRADVAGDTHPIAVVCADVVRHLEDNKLLAALKSMLTSAQTCTSAACGSVDGQLRLSSEIKLLKRACELIGHEARELGISQQVAYMALEGLTSMLAAHSEVKNPIAHVSILTPSIAAAQEPESFDALICCDMDIQAYSLARAEGPEHSYALHLGLASLQLEPIARMRSQFARILRIARSTPILCRVSHTGQAKTQYPAAVWTELETVCRRTAEAAGFEFLYKRIGENAIAQDMYENCLPQQRQVSCQDPQVLSSAAVPYLVLTCPDPDYPSDMPAPLIPRQLSASQIENYLRCPLCWFVSDRIRPSSLDAGFGNMELGNLVHDVLYRFHKELLEQGIERVTTQTLEQAQNILKKTFECVVLEHRVGKTSSSAALIPHSERDAVQIDETYEALKQVLYAEAKTLLGFIPTYLEFSFNKFKVNYAGRPLGGRIDRVDVDEQGRAVVIDYKHRKNPRQFAVQDPTVVQSGDSSLLSDNPEWLPEHTQTLIYAKALQDAKLGVVPKGALYFCTKDQEPGFCGALADELCEQEPGDGHVPHVTMGFPHTAQQGTMSFEQLLNHVESVIEKRLDEMSAGHIHEPEEGCTSQYSLHGLGFTRRDA
ncbi:PD-(D/E)XK nuclease family protein [Collinsella sp. zg1085]|uniref:PD-(D/E)XK nuclease family protein n=1 Tax=Collinsella sp. zg1085 TaxID=2844380 RepID=UPI001C0B9155|nr:PD-(D/E)XK nuclease family protein [Collinsella sp. zg1085]QWT17901.1 PD-(D/E)XK nuclease family protein [Collinsella sp. zg1085]